MWMLNHFSLPCKTAEDGEKRKWQRLREAGESQQIVPKEHRGAVTAPRRPWGPGHRALTVLNVLYLSPVSAACTTEPREALQWIPQQFLSSIWGSTSSTLLWSWLRGWEEEPDPCITSPPARQGWVQEPLLQRVSTSVAMLLPGQPWKVNGSAGVCLG